MNYVDTKTGFTITAAYYKIESVNIDMDKADVIISVYSDVNSRNDLSIRGHTYMESCSTVWPISSTDVMAYAYGLIKALPAYSSAVDV